MKKFLSLLLVAIVLLSSTALASETRTISFWYSAGGANGAVIQSLVDEFNETVGKAANIFVDGQYQGAYTASSNKLSAAIAAGDLSQLPNVVQQGASTVRRLASYEEVIKFEDLLKSGKTNMTKDMFVQNFYYSSYMQGEAIGMCRFVKHIGQGKRKESEEENAIEEDAWGESCCDFGGQLAAHQSR